MSNPTLWSKIGYVVRYILIGLGIFAIALFAFPQHFSLPFNQNLSTTNDNSNTKSALNALDDTRRSVDIVDMLEIVRPAVVAIQTRSELFPLNSNECRSSLRSIPTSTNACAFLNSGSGVFIDQQGHIITNAHVIERAQSIIVELLDGQKLTAELVGADTDSDVALLKVELESKHYLPLPKDDSSKIGQSVFAIGTPNIAFNQTVTRGIVSAKFFSRVSHYIQTDARLRPGNSGGALVNEDGALIGMTSLSSVEQSGDMIYESFAIAANDVRHIVEQLQQDGSVNRGWLGLNGDMSINLRSIAAEMQLNPTQQTQLARHIESLPYGQGIVITALNEQGPAELAGLKTLDIITEVNGSSIRNTGDLMAAIWNLPNGATVSIDYLRDGQAQSTEVTLGQRPR